MYMAPPSTFKEPTHCLLPSASVSGIWASRGSRNRLSSPLVAMHCYYKRYLMHHPCMINFCIKNDRLKLVIHVLDWGKMTSGIMNVGFPSIHTLALCLPGFPSPFLRLLRLAHLHISHLRAAAATAGRNHLKNRARVRGSMHGRQQSHLVGGSATTRVNKRSTSTESATQSTERGGSLPIIAFTTVGGVFKIMHAVKSAEYSVNFQWNSQPYIV